MKLKEPFTDLDINTQDSGFYEGHSLPIALISKVTMVGLVLWAIIWPISATATLDGWNWATLLGFNTFYIIAVGFFAFFLLVLVVLPTGRRKLGGANTTTEFSTFSWFAMMFGAGLGVGLMVFATAEPVGLWGSNPIIVSQGAEPNSPESVQSAFRYSFLHFGFHAWAIYVITGLSLAYYAYTRDMPLTIRTALTPVLGRFANGFIGHMVDVLGVVATILGVAVTIGYGVSQFVDGVYNVTGMEWLMAASVDGAAPLPSTVGLIAALCVIMGMSILSAVSGVGRGIKYLSNLNLVLSLVLLLTFVVFGSFMFSMTTYGKGLADYILHFIPLSFEAYGPLSQSGFESALPAEAEAAASGLYAGATNAWGNYEGFVAGLTGEAAALDPSLQAAAYEDPDNADPLAPLQDAMIVGALPFTFVMVIMAVALAKALINDSRREKAGMTVAEPAE